MLSIIICSIKPDLLAAIKSNIEVTVGVVHEIIAIDNRINARGICAVYNEGADRAIFPFLCFVHEDVQFETVGWGEKVILHLSRESVGLIGVAGGDGKCLVPSSWSSSFVSNEINIIQYDNANSATPEHIVVSADSETKQLNRKRVIALDGVWLCTRKKIFKEFRFDENNLKGFHGYDIDFSLQVNSRYHVCVVFDILLRHYSPGKPDRKWLESATIISKKWKSQLPISVHQLSTADYTQYHWKSMQGFLQKLIQLKYSPPAIIYQFLRYSTNKYFRPRRFFSMMKYLFTNLWTNPHPGNYRVDDSQ